MNDNEVNQNVKKINTNSQDKEILTLSEVSISYAKQKLLDQVFNKITDDNPTVKDININIKKGETIALVGESGSGKSTILKSIAGLLRTKDGVITFDQNRKLSLIHI